MNINKKRYAIRSFLTCRSFHSDILIAFVSLLVVTVISIVWYSYIISSRAILEQSNRLIDAVSRVIIHKITNYLIPAQIMTEVTARIAQTQNVPFENFTENQKLELYMIEILRGYNQFAMFNMGDEQGNFIMVKKFPDGTTGTKLINRTVTPPVVTWKYRDISNKIIRVETSTAPQYDPRTRTWYLGAKKTGRAFWTKAYVFFTDKKTGITASYPIFDNKKQFIGVFSLDIELETISTFLTTLNLAQAGTLFIINNKDQIIACTHNIPLVKKSGQEFTLCNIDELGSGMMSKVYSYHKQTNLEKFILEKDGKKYCARFTPFSKYFDWEIGVIVKEDAFIGPINKARIIAFSISLIILLVGIAIASLIARSISKPIIQLSRETQKIKNLWLEENIFIKSHIMEIQLMRDALTAMKNGLRAFSKYVPAGLVRQLISTGEQARLGGQKREMTILFSDIDGFTSLAEDLAPEDLMPHLSQYFDVLTKIVMRNKGTVDKYIGDALMAFWGAPVWTDKHAVLACRSALLCQKAINNLNSRWKKAEKVALPTRFGIHTGDTVVGNMGSEERMNYSIIGDSVNLANRLEQINKVYGTQIIVSQSTYEKVKDLFIFRPLGYTSIKGKKYEIMIYELVAEKNDLLHENLIKMYQSFTNAIEAFIKQEYETALEIFTNIKKSFPQDKPTEIFIKRCKKYIR